MTKALRVCAEAGCHELTDTTRCHDHTRTRDKARGTRQERGYDAAHVRLRAKWAPKVALGKATCWRCSLRIGVFDVWHLGHCDNDRTQYHGPEHEACNTATATHSRCTHNSHTSSD